MFCSLTARLVSNFVIFMLLARLWGAAGFGEFMYAYTLTLIVAVFIDYGFVTKLVKDISRTPGKLHEIVARAFYAKTVLASFVAIISLIGVWFFTDINFYLFCCLLFAGILGSYGGFYAFILRGLSKFKDEATILFYSNVIFFFIIGLLVFFKCNQIEVAIGFLIARVIYLAISVYYSNRIVGRIPLPLTSVRHAIVTLRQNLPYASFILIEFLYSQLDTVWIHMFLDDRGVGIYQAASRIVVGGLIFTDVLQNVYLPRISRVSDDIEAVKVISRSMLSQLLFVGSMGSILLAGLSYISIDMIYGKAYQAAGGILSLLSILILIDYFGKTYGMILTISNKQAFRATIIFSTLLINIILNTYLIPKFGLYGVVCTSIVSALFLNTVYLIFVKQMIGSLLLTKFDKMLIAGTIVSIFIMVFFHISNVSFHIQIAYLLAVITILISFYIKTYYLKRSKEVYADLK